jgi:hypothetical protein
MDGIAEPALVLDHVFEAIEVAAGAGLDGVAPQFHQTPRGERRAMARRHPLTARLKGSLGASLAGDLGLMFEVMVVYFPGDEPYVVLILEKQSMEEIEDDEFGNGELGPEELGPEELRLLQQIHDNLTAIANEIGALVHDLDRELECQTENRRKRSDGERRAI